MKSYFGFIASLLFIGLCFLCVNLEAQNTGLQKNELYYAGVTSDNSQQNKLLSHSYYPFLDTLYSFPTPSSFPLGLAWDGQYFWNCDSDSRLLYKLTANGSVVTTFQYPSSSEFSDMTWDGTYLWAADEISATLYKIDSNTGLALEQFNLPSLGDPDPNGWGLAWDGQYLWHSEYGDSARIYKINPQNGEVISSFVPSSHSLLGIAWAEGNLYGIGIAEALIYKFDPSTGEVLDSSYWEIPYPLGLVWDGQNFWNVSSSISFGGKARIYEVSNSIISSVDNSTIIPHNFFLMQNYPNPFNPTTSIDYQIKENGFVSLKVYDMLGNEVASLVNETQSAGQYSVVFNAGSLASGIYFYSLRENNLTQIRKMSLLK